MDFEAEQKLTPELGRGERLLWSGMPRQGLRLQTSDWFLVPFSLLWGGFALFWEFMVIRGGAPVFFTLWGVPFVVMGLYLIVGRFFADSYQRARTYYGVTDQRVLILGGLFNRQTTSIALQTLGEVSIAERRDRSGSITFGTPNATYPAWWGSSWPGTSYRSAPAFDLIGDVRQVYNAIREAQRAELGRGRA
jgi:Bacterial PH domain